VKDFGILLRGSPDRRTALALLQSLGKDVNGMYEDASSDPGFDAAHQAFRKSSPATTPAAAN
jgi:hypothetical protein